MQGIISLSRQYSLFPEGTIDQLVERYAREAFIDVLVCDNELTVYVPSRDKHGQPIDFKSLARAVQKRLKELFGGFTAVTGSGGSQESSVSEFEEVMSISSSTTAGLLLAHLHEVFELARWIVEAFDQDSVAVAVNRKMFLLAKAKKSL